MDMEIFEFENTQRVLEEYGKMIEAKYRDELIKAKKNATHSLIESVHYEIWKGDQRMAVDLNLKEYWKYIEYDTRPHFPPRDAIRQWVLVKPVIPKPMKNGLKPSVNQLTYLIQRKIGLEGTKGSHLLEKSMEEVNRAMMDDLEEAITMDLMGNVDAMIKTWVAK